MQKSLTSQKTFNKTNVIQNKCDRKSSNVADTFDSYFSSIPHKLLSENHFQLPYNSINLDDYVKTKMPLENSFDIPFVSNYFVHKFLSSLDVNKHAD